MSEEQPKPEEAPAAQGGDGAAAPKSKPALTYIVVAVATVLGGVVGTMVVAPKLIAARNAKAQAEAEKSKDEGKEGEGKDKKEKEKRPLVKIDNLIVNPAGSQGTRFLMVSLAIGTTSAEIEEKLRAGEAQIRDVVISLLQQQTMESIATPGMRDSIKIQLSNTISALVGSKEKLQVFLPQFVVQ